MSHTIKITKYEVTDHTEYTFLVFSHHDEGTWHFKRRYAALYSFNEALLQSEISDVPKFPPKKLFCNLSLPFIENRLLGLQRYFEEISKSPTIYKSKAFKSFIKPDDKVQVQNPKEKKKNSYQRRSQFEIHRQLENQYNLMFEDFNQKVIDLSFIANPINDEDLHARQKVFKDVVDKFHVQSDVTKMPLGKEENKINLAKAVSHVDWIGSKLELLTENLETCQILGENPSKIIININ